MRVERDGDVAVVVLDNPPVNASTAAVRAGLLDALRATAADETVTGVVLIGAGKHLMSGSDLREFSVDELPEPQLPEVLAAIEAHPRPVVAALSGATLGGGLELALACDRRVALADCRVGLPEVGLGMIPGAGGSSAACGCWNLTACSTWWLRPNRSRSGWSASLAWSTRSSRIGCATPRWPRPGAPPSACSAPCRHGRGNRGCSRKPPVG
ncbi:enoyl-CoA hydratase/isomerase family protein [Saccharopolyspora spinosporotrichia]